MNGLRKTRVKGFIYDPRQLVECLKETVMEDIILDKLFYKGNCYLFTVDLADSFAETGDD